MWDLWRKKRRWDRFFSGMDGFVAAGLRGGEGTCCSRHIPTAIRRCYVNEGKWARLGIAPPPQSKLEFETRAVSSGLQGLSFRPFEGHAEFKMSPVMLHCVVS
jgi:hypothetical protein